MIPLKKYPDSDFGPGAAEGNRGEERILPGVVAAYSEMEDLLTRADAAMYEQKTTPSARQHGLRGQVRKALRWLAVVC